MTATHLITLTNEILISFLFTHRCEDKPNWFAENIKDIERRLSLARGLSIGFQTSSESDPESEWLYVKKRFKSRQVLVQYIQDNKHDDTLVPRASSVDLKSFSWLAFSAIMRLGFRGYATWSDLAAVMPDMWPKLQDWLARNISSSSSSTTNLNWMDDSANNGREAKLRAIRRWTVIITCSIVH